MEQELPDQVRLKGRGTDTRISRSRAQIYECQAKLAAEIEKSSISPDQGKYFSSKKYLARLSYLDLLEVVLYFLDLCGLRNIRRFQLKYRLKQSLYAVKERRVRVTQTGSISPREKRRLSRLQTLSVPGLLERYFEESNFFPRVRFYTSFFESEDWLNHRRYIICYVFPRLKRALDTKKYVWEIGVIEEVISVLLDNLKIIED